MRSLALVSVAVFAALNGLRLAAPPLAPRVNIRWAAGVSPDERVAIERRFSLQAPQHLEDTTWAYDLVDPSRVSVRALIGHQAVADTHGIDREDAVVAAEAAAGTTRVGSAPLLEWAVAEWVRWLAVGALWTALLSGLWLASTRRTATPGTTPHTPDATQSLS